MFLETTHMTRALIGQLSRYYTRMAAWPRSLVRAAIYMNEYSTISVSIVAVLVVAVYAAMFGNYCPHTLIDTPWYLSYSYNYCIKGISNDVSFGSTLPFGLGGGTVVS